LTVKPFSLTLTNMVNKKERQFPGLIALTYDNGSFHLAVDISPDMAIINLSELSSQVDAQVREFDQHLGEVGEPTADPFDVCIMILNCLISWVREIPEAEDFLEFIKGELKEYLSDS
jgi:hypothetical protein